MAMDNQHGSRANLKDVWWNAFMVKDCTQWYKGMPLCATSRMKSRRVS